MPKSNSPFIVFGLFVLSFFYACTPKQISIDEVPNCIKDDIHTLAEHTLFAAADGLKYQQDYWAACQAYEALAKQEVDLEPTEKDYLNNQLLYLYLKTYQLEKAKSLLDQFQADAGSSDVNNADWNFNKAYYLLKQGKGAQAIAYIQQAEQLYLKIYGENHLKYLETQKLLGTYYYQNISLDSLALTTDLIFKILQENKALDDFGKEYFYLKAQALQFEKNHEKGLNQVDIAIGKAKEFGRDTIFLGRCYTLRSHLLRKLDKRETAKASMKKALALSPSIARYPIALMEMYENMALGVMKEPDTSFFYSILDSIRHNFEHFPNAQQDPDCLLGYYHYKKGNYTQAIALYRALIDKYEKDANNHHAFYDEAFFVLTEMYRKKHVFDSAVYYNQRSIELLVGSSEIAEGENYFESIEPDFRHTLTIFLSKAPLMLYEAYKKEPTQLAKLEQAVSSFLTLDSLFFIHATIKEEAALLEFAEEHFNSTYEVAIQASLAAYRHFGDHTYLNHAHFFMERVKYGAMSRGIMNRRFRASLADSSRQKIENIETKIQQLYRLKFEQLEEENLALNEQIAIQENLRKAAISSIQSNDASAHAYTINTLIPSLERLQKTIDKPIVQYYMAAQSVHCIILKADSMQTLSWPVPANLVDLAKDYISLLAKATNAYRPKAYSAFLQESHQLYQHLIAPIMPLLKGHRSIVFCPDANFPQFPYESLLTDTVAAAHIDYAFLPYLVKQLNISYTPSLKVLLDHQANKPAVWSDAKVLAYAFSEQQELSKKAQTRGKRSNLAPLAGSVIDLQAIEKNFGTDKDAIKLRFGSAANAHNFKQDLKNSYDIVHLALHAVSTPNNRWNNQIFFPNNAAPTGIDTLFSTDIEQLSFDHALVVLSACETAIGTNLAAEGIYSLARSCFIADANQVIASLWKVQDDIAAKIITLFYDELKKGHSVEQSLYQAKLNYLNHKADEYSAFPSFWASLVLFN